MRPLRLQLENLASFRGKHEPLELEGFELFAIAGPTGAGKSSLLDAIVFALYGRVPRLGKSVSELVALGRDRLAVTLDFRVAGKVYRVARALNRARKGKASEAALEELVDGDERPIVDGVAGVNKALERILGLGYDAFTQAVILPQGEFHRFLKSEPAQRRAILANLLRLRVYERMYDRAAAEASRLRAFLQGQEAVIEGETEVATPELIAAARARHEAVLAEAGGLRAEQEPRERRLLALRTRRQKTLELDEAERRLRALRAGEKQALEAERRAKAASLAEQLRPRLEAAERERAALRSWTNGWEKARRAETEATLTAEAAGRELRAADKAAEQVPRLGERLRELDAVSGLLAPLESAQRRLAEAKQRQERADRELEAARGAEKEARARAKAAQKALRAADERLAASRYDAARHERLERHRDAAAQLGQVRAAAQKADSEQAAARDAAARLLGLERRASEAALQAEQAHERATAAFAAAESEQRQAERAHAATHLRASLREGEPCPVCEQPVARVPGAAPAAALEAVAERAGAARSGMEAARAALVTRREELAAAAGESRQARARAEAAAQEKQAASNALDEAQARLLGAIGDDLPARGKRPLDERLRESLEQLAVARGEHEAGAALLERARHEDESARQALAGAGEAAAAQARALEEQAQAAQQAAQEARELRTRIEAVTRGVDPAAERTRLERERTRLGESQQAAQRRERDAAEGLLQARLQREQAQRAMTDAQRALGEATGALDEGLSAAGFKNAAAAQAAVLPEPQRRELQQLADDFRSETHAAKARLQELERELQDGRASAEEVQAAEEEFVGARQRLEDASNEAARLSERLLDLERRAERARQLSEALQRERRRQALQQQLATDLRSENFRAFVLEEAFHELVAGASERLMSLSGRYAFAFEDDAFLVLDHDNAGERRSAETLSGGETFLASLALALELSQQIQRAAGAVSLESLFIDEGFGTLDPETLETITGALEDLPVGGRMVGIITHLPELTERIPNRVRVVKRPEGSRFTIETA